MNVESICTRHVVSLDGNQTLQQAALMMREHHVGALVVTQSEGEGSHIVGVVSDRDLAIEVLARGGDASQVPVARLVQRPPVSVPAQSSPAQAVEAMQAAGVRRLLVHDGQGHLVGLLSFDDLLPALAAPLAGLAEVLRRQVQNEVEARGAIAAPPRPALRVPAIGTVGWQTGGA